MIHHHNRPCWCLIKHRIRKEWVERAVSQPHISGLNATSKYKLRLESLFSELLKTHVDRQVQVISNNRLHSLNHSQQFALSIHFITHVARSSAQCWFVRLFDSVSTYALIWVVANRFVIRECLLRNCAHVPNYMTADCTKWIIAFPFLTHIDARIILNSFGQKESNFLRHIFFQWQCFESTKALVFISFEQSLNRHFQWA